MAIAKTLNDMKRVWKVTKKPTKKEYFQTFKIVLIGLVIVGLIGFFIAMLWQSLLIGLFPQ
ncbi:MAG: protein translocase SEC61 complex subunit gamma [Candidatus Woesearchaeota archaeon]|jgi:protein transport protein SEC61 subunit gamma-like protein|nr:protein translocase SEC61 complex subunit gamma [Candidatus Woesearchaeota archaeon]